MAEYYTPAIVLDRDTRNDKDWSFVFYTKELGKIRAIAKSARKITSKASGHLSIGRLADIRVIDKGSFQLLDTLSRESRCKDIEMLRFTHFLNKMTPLGEVDLQVWHLAKKAITECIFTPELYQQMLIVMGFAPVEGDKKLKCQKCKSKVATSFYIPDIVFLCSNCPGNAKIDNNDLVQIS